MSAVEPERPAPPSSRPKQHIDFVRPPPAPPMTAEERRYEPLVTLSGCLMILGVLLTFSGCGVTLLLWGWGAFGAAGAATGIGVFVLACGLRAVVRRLQKRA